jgi:hypothetical protein
MDEALEKSMQSMPDSERAKFKRLLRNVELLHDEPRSASNQSMKPTAPFRDKLSQLATTPCRGLSLSR